MNVFIFYFVTIAAVVFIIQKIFFWTAILQKNEYEIKKTFRYLSSRKEIFPLFFGIENTLHILLICLYFVTLIESRSTPYYTFSVALFFLSYLVFLIRRIHSRSILIPQIDFQMIMTFLVVFPFCIGLMLFPLLDDFFWYLMICKIVVFVIFAATIIFQLPKSFYRDALILKNQKKISKLSHIKTIVILGESKRAELQTVLSQFLSQNHAVTNVVGNGSIHNITQTISKNITPQTEYFIVPIVSQEKEEIVEIIHTLNPVLCIIHENPELSFKQSERDFEEFVSVINKRTKILSVGYTQQSDFLKNRKLSNFLVTEAPRKIKNLYLAKSLVIHRSFSSFVLKTPGGKTIRVKTPIINPAIVSSVMTVAAGAFELDFKIIEINKYLSAILPINGLLNSSKIKSGSVLINAKQDVMAEESLNFLEQVRGGIGRKIVVFSASQDFGRANKTVYQHLGKKISKHADIVYLTDSTQNKFTASGISYRTKKSRFLMAGSSEIKESLQKKLHKNDVCVFIGIQSSPIFNSLTNITGV